ncbi:MMS21 E3 SUMO-protein ligase MMS21 [Candida maltosa Xu316]
MSSFDTDSSNVVLPSNLSLPDYVPLRRDAVRDFEDQFRQTTTDDIYSAQLLQVKSMAEHYITYIMSNSHLNFSEKTLEEYIKTFENLSKVQQESHKLKQIHDLPNIRSFSSRETQELTLDSLDEFHAANQPNFTDVIRQEYSNVKTRSTSNDASREFYTFLRSVLFVCKNPEDAIPDEKNDDEINISGGKVSLKDPITLNYFETPVLSKRCKHTYEESSIRTHLRTNNTCPISGCSAMLTLGDLKPDKLMRIRIRSAIRVEKRHDKNLETVV